MFPQFKKINNESGIVLFIVLMTAIIIMIFSVGILTQSMNEINYAQQQIDQITSDQLTKGIFWNTYNPDSNSITVPEPQSMNVSNRAYNITFSSTSNDAAIDSYNVVANYDTFN